MRNYVLAFLMIFSFANLSTAQCDTWVGKSNENEATDAHSIYRQALKAEDFTVAEEYWEQAYAMAPAADGKRDYHYTDGVKILINKLAGVTDADEKKAIKERVIGLYDQAISCFDSRSITLKCGTSDECYNGKLSYLYGRKGYDMFYSLVSPYSANLESLEKSIEYGGNDTEYIVFDPVARIVVSLFQKGKIDKDKAISLHSKLEEIAVYNAANNERLGEYYTQAWKAAQNQYKAIEDDIFDCTYFLPIYMEEYNQSPEDPDVIKSVLVRLKRKGCAEDLPELKMLDDKWKKYASQVNAARQAEFNANNPGYVAKQLYDEGKFQEAVDKYQEAIDGEADPDQKAKYMFSLASIKFRKLKAYSEARKLARDAAKLKPNWGKPFMLIGDMYGSSARNCGDSWNQRLAILAAIDKYNYAKSIDPNVADDARSRISKYNASLPLKSEGFQRGKSAGQTAKVGCWIGETVKLRFKD